MSKETGIIEIGKTNLPKLEDLEASPLTYSIIILDKPKIIQILEMLEVLNDLNLLKNKEQ